MAYDPNPEARDWSWVMTIIRGAGYRCPFDTLHWNAVPRENGARGDLHPSTERPYTKDRNQPRSTERPCQIRKCQGVECDLNYFRLQVAEWVEICGYTLLSRRSTSDYSQALRRMLE